MSGDLFSGQAPARKAPRAFMIDSADRPCGHPGCAARAVFFQTLTPMATVFGREHRWAAMWCGDHCPADWFPARKARAA